MNKGHQPLIVLAIGSFLVSALSWGIWIAVNGDHRSMVVGGVTEVASSSMMVASRDQTETKVVITDATTIRRGKEDVSFSVVTPGTFVQVSGTMVGTTVVADTVQLLQPPSSKRPQHGG